MLDLVLHALATWRVSNMLVSERGPFDIFVWVRTQTGIQHYPDGDVAHADPKNPLSCLWCTSVWVGLLLCIAPKWLLRALAASAVAIVIKEKALNG